MSKEKPSQSQSISSSQISGSQVQLGQAEGNLIQSQQGNQSAIGEQALTSEEVVKLLGEVEEMLRDSKLLESKKEEAIDYL